MSQLVANRHRTKKGQRYAPSKRRRRASSSPGSPEARKCDQVSISFSRSSGWIGMSTPSRAPPLVRDPYSHASVGCRRRWSRLADGTTPGWAACRGCRGCASDGLLSSTAFARARLWWLGNSGGRVRCGIHGMRHRHTKPPYRVSFARRLRSTHDPLGGGCARSRAAKDVLPALRAVAHLRYACQASVSPTDLSNHCTTEALRRRHTKVTL